MQVLFWCGSIAYEFHDIMDNLILCCPKQLQNAHLHKLINSSSSPFPVASDARTNLTVAPFSSTHKTYSSRDKTQNSQGSQNFWFFSIFLTQSNRKFIIRSVFDILGGDNCKVVTVSSIGLCA